MSGVTLDAIMTGGNGTGGACQEQASATTSVTATAGHSIIVGSGATLLVAILNLADNSLVPTSLACTWNGVSMNLACSAYNTAGSGNGAAIFTLVNPASGQNALAATWLNTHQAYLSAISFFGTDTVTGYRSADNATGTNTGTPISVSVSTSANDATVCTAGDQASSIVIATQTQIFKDTNLICNGAGSYALGGSSSNTHTFTTTGSTSNAWAAIHIIAPAATPTNNLLLASNQGGF